MAIETAHSITQELYGKYVFFLSDNLDEVQADFYFAASIQLISST
jgi:hypothetical protein